MGVPFPGYFVSRKRRDAGNSKGRVDFGIAVLSLSLGLTTFKRYFLYHYFADFTAGYFEQY